MTPAEARSEFETWWNRVESEGRSPKMLAEMAWLTGLALGVEMGRDAAIKPFLESYSSKLQELKGVR